MNTGKAPVLYLVSVVSAFIVGSYLTQEAEAVRGGSAEYVNVMALDIAAKLLAADLGHDGCDSLSLSSTTLTRAPADAIDSDAARNQRLGRSISTHQSRIALTKEVLQPEETEVTDDGGFYYDELIRERVEGLIDQLDPWQLEYVILSATGMSSDELSEIGDLHSYASQLATVTMDGVVTETSSSLNTPSTIEFTRNIISFYQGESGETAFDSSAGRIYAVFPTDSYDGDSVLMKWYRTDMPSRVHVKMQPLLQGAPYNYVWAEVEEWPEALYKVEIYSSGESLEQLAAGEYEVVSGHRQTLEMEHNNLEKSN